MSPEQARGQQVDHRTDIWALGCVLYEMVAGRSPFAAQSSSDVLAAILDREPAPLTRFEPDLPAELQRIVHKTLRKNPQERYQTASDLVLDVKSVRDQLQSGAGDSGHIGRSNHRVPSRPAIGWVAKPWLILFGVLVATALLAAGIGSLRMRARLGDHQQRAFGIGNMTRLNVSGHGPVAAISADGRYVAHVQ